MNHFCNAACVEEKKKRQHTETKSMVKTVLLTDLSSLPKTKNSVRSSSTNILPHF